MSEAPSDLREHATGTLRELREYSRGVLDVDHRDVHPIAGLIDDPEVRETLGFMAEVWDPSREDVEAGAPRNFWETQLAQRAIRKYATNIATDAIRDGNVSQAAFLTGLPSYESDVSGLHAINQLAEWLVDSEQCKLIYLAALMGRGKTDLSLTFCEVIADHYARVERAVGDQVDVPEPEFAANFHAESPPDAPEIEEFRRYDDLLEWAERGSSAEERWFIFDEASTELTAQSGKNAQKVAEQFAPFVKKMRKMGVNMIVIGHDKGDVHVAIRSLADFVDKTGLKTASFYAGIKKREPTGHLFDVAGIPPTSWTFDTDDTAEWDWCLDDEANDDRLTESEVEEQLREYRNERIAALRSLTDEDGDPLLTQRELATALDVSAATISRIEQEYSTDD